MLDEPEYLTTSRAAHLLRVSEMTVRAMADRGDLPCRRTSTGARLFRPEDVERLAGELQQHRGRVLRSDEPAVRPASPKNA